jgi:protein SCO1/2
LVAALQRFFARPEIFRKEVARQDLNRRTSRLFRGGFVIAIVTAAVLSAATGVSAAARIVSIGGPFELIAADGARVTDADYRGDWLLIFFGYSFCPDICPTTLSVVAEALDRLGGDAERLRPIFISVDPNRDTPESLGAYVAAIDARLIALTGSPAQIAAVADAYGVHHKSHQVDAADRFYAVDHSTYLYLVDPDGAFVRALNHAASSDEIAAVVRENMQRR